MVKQTIAARISQRRRQIMVHSAIYYRFNENIISDHDFDRWCKELAELQGQHPKEAKKAAFAKEFETFDGSTGFHLADHPWGVAKAQYLLDLHHSGNLELSSSPAHATIKEEQPPVSKRIGKQLTLEDIWEDM